MFVTFEGLDFSGKSTQAAILVQKLKAAQRTVHLLREPGGTRLSERIRLMLLDKGNREMDDAAEVFLFSAARAQLVREVIAPALERGEHVVCDRYYDSTTAYQGYGRGIDLGLIRAINRLAVGEVIPHVTFCVEIPVDEIERRKKKAGILFDRMESAGKAFYERVCNGYREIARLEPQRVVMVDGTDGIEQIADRIWARIEPGLVQR